MTVLEVIQRSTEFLGKRGVDSPRLQTELLVAHVLQMPRMQLYLNFERVLTPAEVDSLRLLVQRRGQREPVQHITGLACFCGLDIAVNQQVLIPRPETELLAELAWQFLNKLSAAKEPVGWATAPPDGSSAGQAKTGERIRVTNRGSGRAEPTGGSPVSVPLVQGQPFSKAGSGHARAFSADVDETRGPIALDFGSGSGCLAIAIALNCPAVRLQAIDISREALELAAKNAGRHGLTQRVSFSQGDGFAAVGQGTQYDLIVSNPPYIPTAEIETLQPEVRDHDPHQALDGGTDGLDFYRRLAAEAMPFLKAEGKMLLEFGDGQAEQIWAIFEKQNWIVEHVVADYTQRPRILIVRPADRTG